MTTVSPKPDDRAGAGVDTLRPMLVADLLGVAASSARVPGFGRRPHQLAYAVCVAAVVRRMIDDRARHPGAVVQLALLGALSRTRGGSRSHRGIAMAATVAAAATSRSGPDPSAQPTGQV